jgi:ADP-heptose:LPS heptosyltransferase
MDSTTSERIVSNNDWSSCKNILIIRADNLGDLIMSTPAIRALKETFGAKITVLTSQMATGIAKHIEEIDEVIMYDLPWVKTNNAIASDSFYEVVKQLKDKQFDAAVIFTVCSQNPLPAAMLAYLAAIPKRLAYCRENPYDLLTNWVPDKEPYDLIKHQVSRDLDLVKTIGANTNNDKLSLIVPVDVFKTAEDKMKALGIDLSKAWFICHAGVSEAKRQFPEGRWIKAGKRMRDEGYQLLFTGTKNERELTDTLANGIGSNAFSAAGLFTLEEFISVIKNTHLVLSVNTGTVHIAAGVATPVVVLYAATNPQHTPWKIPCKVLLFGVSKKERSKNEVIQFLYKEVYNQEIAMPSADEIVNACFELLAPALKAEHQITETLTSVTD